MKKYLILLIIILLVGCMSRERQSSNSRNDTTLLSDVSTAKEDKLIEDLEYRSIGDTINWTLRPPHYYNNGIRSYDKYKLEPKEEGKCFVLSNQEEEYLLSYVFDYGAFDILIYEHYDSELLFLGLADFYGSTYFIYHLYNGKINRVGDLSFSQAEDVELTGSKYAMFDVQQIDNVVFKDLLLDNIWNKRYEKHI